MFKNIRFKNSLRLLTIGITVSAIARIETSNTAQAQSAPKVVASHSVICDLLDTVAQETIDLTCLLDGNRDPHTYRPTPQDRKAIEEAQLIFYGGYQLEPLITKLIADTQVPKIALYEQAVTEPIMAEHKHGHGDEHEDEGEHSEAEATPESKEADPHVWHNIENTVKMVEAIRSIMLQVNPPAAEQYLVNSSTLTEQLWQLDGWIKEQIATIPEGKKVLVTSHDSFNYYTQAYYLEDYLTLQGLSAESSPTASQVRELSQEIKETGVPTIFAESTKSDRVIRNVAKAADVELSMQPLYADGLGAAENYLDMMSHNTCAIVDGLGGECKPFSAVAN